MDDSVLTKTKRFFRKNDFTFRLVLFIIVVAAAVYGFLQGDTLLKIFTMLAVGTMLASFLSHYVFNFFYGEGYKLAYVLNEILYLFIGIPIMLIVIGYLPLSFYISFFASEDSSTWIVPMLIGIMVSLQVLSFFYIIRHRGKEMGKNIWQLVKYLFDFKTRAEEQRKHRERAEQIDDFYEGMKQVKSRVEKRMEESTVGFSEYEWKSSKGMQIQEQICWSCRTVNSAEAIVCQKCGVRLKTD